jgi:hypothetical protein
MINAKAVVVVLLAAAGLALTLGAPRRAQAYPEPSLLQRDWQFDFKYDTPKPIAVRDLNGVVRWYWYMSYKVVNDTGAERLFIPEITVATEEGDIIRAGRGVPAVVFARIRDREGGRLLESPSSVVGRILRGQDNARESVAVWPAFNHDVTNVSIFVGGLSGEARDLRHPVTGETVLVNKTFMIDFDFPGNPTSPQYQRVAPKGDRWIMR